MTETRCPQCKTTKTKLMEPLQGGKFRCLSPGCVVYEFDEDGYWSEGDYPVSANHMCGEERRTFTKRAADTNEDGTITCPTCGKHCAVLEEQP